MNRFCIALAAAAVALPAFAQAPAPQRSATDATQAGVTQKTKQFVERAAVGDMYEIQASQLVADKVQNREFRDFSRMIIDDHSKASEKLKSIVQGMRDVQVPQQLDDKHKRMIEQLKSATAADFARQYKSQQVQAHQDAVKLYEDFASQGDNTQLREFAEATLPKLKDHLRMAQDLPNNPQVAQSGAQDKRAAQRTDRQQAGQILSEPGPDHIMASALRGTRVLGANDANVGEINDVVLTTNGEVAAVVVGVGGFLGVGEKNVAIPFSELDVRRSAGTTGRATNGDRQDRASAGPMEPQRIYLRDMSKQELEQAPSFRTTKN